MPINRQDVRTLLSFTRMMLRDRFLGSALGVLWAVLNPILMLGIFTFVFAFVFQARLPGAERSLTYVIWLLSGYGPWLAITESLATGTISVTANAGLVKNLPLKTELLPIAGCLMGFVPLAVSMVFLGGLMMVDDVEVTWRWLWVVPAMAIQFLLCAGLALFLSAINVFVRDTALVLPNVLTIVLFASPIFYPVDAFPAALRPLVSLNPLFVLSEAYRGPIVRGASPRPLGLLYVACLALVLAWLGLAFFRRLKGYFDARL